ncbi:MAG: hypothetical protein WCL16_02405 [bacterium]
MATNRQRQKASRSGESGMRFFSMFVVMLSLAAAGCVGSGLLYTRVVKPYSYDFDGTPTGVKICRVNEHMLREPITRANLSVSFTSRIVEQASRAAGITNLYFADIETLSVLKGIYVKKTLIIHGD